MYLFKTFCVIFCYIPLNVKIITDTVFMNDFSILCNMNNIFSLCVATIFASLLLKSPAKQDLAEKRKTQEFFQHFLTQSSS